MENWTCDILCYSKQGTQMGKHTCNSCSFKWLEMGISKVNFSQSVLDYEEWFREPPWMFKLLKWLWQPWIMLKWLWQPWITLKWLWQPWKIIFKLGKLFTCTWTRGSPILLLSYKLLKLKFRAFNDLYCCYHGNIFVSLYYLFFNDSAFLWCYEMQH